MSMIRSIGRFISHACTGQLRPVAFGRWPGHENPGEPEKLCPVHRAFCD